jgi:hypothetical protein
MVADANDQSNRRARGGAERVGAKAGFRWRSFGGGGVWRMVRWRSQARRSAGRFVEVETAAGVAPARELRAMLCAELALPGGAVLRVYHRGGEGGGA